jgi:gas vesicle protein
MSNENGSLGTNLLSFLLGVAAGAAVVALVTPTSGPDLRVGIKDLARMLRRDDKDGAKAREAGIPLG